MSEYKQSGSGSQSVQALPELPLNAWQDTHDTLHMWTQIVGKIRLALAPMMNHWWQVTLYLTPRGMTTSPMPYNKEQVQIDFDFINHALHIQSSRGSSRSITLAARPVADFYHELMDALQSMGIYVKIWTLPVEVEERIPFEEDQKHKSYDPDYANRFWRVLLETDRVMKIFRGSFCGKSSPVHFFWGSFDLAFSRFSGREAPLITRAENVAKFVMQEAYAHEVSSCGFWPGAGLGEPAFYAYTYPEPEGFRDYAIQPSEAFSHPDLREFILPYESVRTSGTWEEDLLSFFQTTYEAGANLAHWDREALEQSLLISPDE